MSRWFSAIVGAGCILAAIFPTSFRAQTVSRTILTLDLDGDGVLERIVLDPRRDPSVSVSRRGRSLWAGVPSKWRPWKLQVADADGDGRLDIAIGVTKSTRFFPEPHNCLFIYGWDGKDGYPKWLGSSLSRPFTDFIFLKRSLGDAWPLMAVEIDRNARSSVGVYAWNGFGFSLESRFGDWEPTKLLAVMQR